jgi:hypothetical protein
MYLGVALYCSISLSSCGIRQRALNDDICSYATTFSVLYRRVSRWMSRAQLIAGYVGWMVHRHMQRLIVTDRIMTLRVATREKWLIGLLIGCLIIGWPTGWLLNLLVDRRFLYFWRTGRWVPSLLFDSLIEFLVSVSVAWFVGWLFDWLLLIGWLVGYVC